MADEEAEETVAVAPEERGDEPEEARPDDGGSASPHAFGLEDRLAIATRQQRFVATKPNFETLLYEWLQRHTVEFDIVGFTHRTRWRARRDMKSKLEVSLGFIACLTRDEKAYREADAWVDRFMEDLQHLDKRVHVRKLFEAISHWYARTDLGPKRRAQLQPFKADLDYLLTVERARLKEWRKQQEEVQAVVRR